MFKRLIEKILGRWRKPSGDAPPVSAPQTGETRKAEPAAFLAPESEPERVTKLEPAGAKERWEQESARPFELSGSTPEQICGIAPRMDQEEIRAQLAMLYRRHTRAESSPDASLRQEAAIMLDLIAGLQEKHLGSALALPDPDEE